jgi:7-carboxy-7-deazaguanine synthase
MKTRLAVYESGKPEIFSSIQGEGPRAGQRALFIRLSGCNLRCNFCDTKYSYTGKEFDNNYIIKEIQKYNGNLIVITGGEPLLQKPELIDLFKKMAYNNLHHIIQFETNGTIEPFVINDDIPWPTFRNVEYVVSPKMGNIKFEILRSFKKNTYGRFWFKFVIEKKDDLDNVTSIVDVVGIDKDRVYLMPEGVEDAELKKKAPMIFEYCVEKGYRFSHRLQVWLYGKKRGV